VEPRDRCGAGLRHCHGEGRSGGINAGHLSAASRQQDGQGPCTAADVEHVTGVELVGNAQIRIEVCAVAIERVVDSREARVGKDRIGHSTAP
jgi:hypothetical protein